MFGLSVHIDFRFTPGIKSRSMTDWIDRLTKSVSKAVEHSQKDAEQKKYILHTAEVLKARGSELWLQFVQSCKDNVNELNKHLDLKFPNEQDKQVEWSDKDSRHFSLRGSFPSFSMEVTYNAEQHSISLSGSRTFASTTHGKNKLFFMDLDEDGNPCLTTDNHRRISLEDASKNLLELCLSEA